MKFDGFIMMKQSTREWLLNAAKNLTPMLSVILEGYSICCLFLSIITQQVCSLKKDSLLRLHNVSCEMEPVYTNC